MEDFLFTDMLNVEKALHGKKKLTVFDYDEIIAKGILKNCVKTKIT